MKKKRICRQCLNLVIFKSMYKKQSYRSRAKNCKTTTRKRSNIILKTFETSD